MLTVDVDSVTTLLHDISADVNDPGQNHTLTVEGDSMDTVEIGNLNNWAVTAGVDYDLYESNSNDTEMLIDNDIVIDDLMF